jgi:hypothetical protein
MGNYGEYTDKASDPSIFPWLVYGSSRDLAQLSSPELAWKATPPLRPLSPR